MLKPRQTRFFSLSNRESPPDLRTRWNKNDPELAYKCREYTPNRAAHNAVNPLIIIWRGWKAVMFGNGGNGNLWLFASDRARRVGRYNERAVHPRYVNDPDKSNKRVSDYLLTWGDTIKSIFLVYYRRYWDNYLKCISNANRRNQSPQSRIRKI